jgi:hypothetical protein
VSKPSSGVICNDSSDDEGVQEVIRSAMLQGGSSMYAKGDKISIIKGDLTGLKGTVVAIEESGNLTFKPMGIA